MEAAASSPGGGNGFIVARNLGLNTVRVRCYSGVDLDIPRMTVHGLCAEQGSGKTELLLSLAGRMRPSTGSLVVGGAPVDSLRALDGLRRKSGLGFFDNLNEVEQVLPVRTVTSAELNLAGRASRRASTVAYLAEWGLDDLADQSVASLSRYDYDLLGMALGMAADPDILVVQDIERDLSRRQTAQLVRRLRSVAATHGTTVVCGVTDYDVATLLDGVTCLTEGARAQRDSRHHAHEGDGLG